MLAIVGMCGMHHIAFHHQVLKNKLGRVGVVGMYATHFGGCQHHGVGLLGCEKFIHCSLVAQVEFGVGAHHNVAVAQGVQAAHNCAAHHAPVACHIYF